MKKKITLCMVLSTFIICAMLCLTNCSNDDAPTSVFTPEKARGTNYLLASANDRVQYRR